MSTTIVSCFPPRTRAELDDSTIELVDSIIVVVVVVVESLFFDVAVVSAALLPGVMLLVDVVVDVVVVVVDVAAVELPFLVNRTGDMCVAPLAATTTDAMLAEL